MLSGHGSAVVDCTSDAAWKRGYRVTPTRPHRASPTPKNQLKSSGAAEHCLSSSGSKVCALATTTVLELSTCPGLRRETRQAHRQDNPLLIFRQVLWRMTQGTKHTACCHVMCVSACQGVLMGPRAVTQSHTAVAITHTYMLAITLSDVSSYCIRPHSLMLKLCKAACSRRQCISRRGRTP